VIFSVPSPQFIVKFEGEETLIFKGIDMFVVLYKNSKDFAGVGIGGGTGGIGGGTGGIGGGTGGIEVFFPNSTYKRINKPNKNKITKII
jgi:hypothetical protein